MKNYTIYLGIALLVAGAVIGSQYLTTANPTPKGAYCSSEGELTNMQPIQSHRSYCIKLATSVFKANETTQLVYSIVDDQGETLKDFEILHEKLMHLIVVRKDLQNFQHLHPELNEENGEFTTEVTFPTDGQYRMFTDMSPQGVMKDPMGMPLAVTPFTDIKVGTGRYQAQELGEDTNSVEVDDYNVRLAIEKNPTSNPETKLTFHIMRDGKPVVDLEPYLGAMGHAVVIREYTLDYIHTHALTESRPANGQVDFMVTLPQEGRYKVMGQFQHKGKIITSDFVVTVAEGSSGGESAGHDLMGH